MRTIPAAAKRAGARPVQLVEITTYTDREAETVGEVFRLGPTSIVFPRDGGSDLWYQRGLVELAPLEVEADHLAAQRGGASGLDTAWRVTLANVDYEGASSSAPLAQLLASAGVAFARLELLTVWVPPAHPDGVDLRDLAGTEYTTFFRGEISADLAVDGARRTITLEARAELPELPWLRLTSESGAADPSDLGAHYPLPYGDHVRVRLIRDTVGAATTLAAKVTKTQTGIWAMTSTAGLSGSGSLWISGELVTYGTVTATGLTVTGRAQQGTTAVEHYAGEPVIESVAELWLHAAGFPISDVHDLYLKNPINGELFRVTTGYTLDLDHAPGGVPKPAVRILGSDFRAMMAEAQNVAKVTVQPSYSGGSPPSSSVYDLATWSISSISGNSGVEQMEIKGIGGDAQVAHWMGGSGSRNILTFTGAHAVPGGAAGSDLVTSWRLEFTAENDVDFEATSGTVVYYAQAHNAVPGFANGANIGTFPGITIPNEPTPTTVTLGPFTPPAGTDIDDMRAADFRVMAGETATTWTGPAVIEMDVGLNLEITANTSAGDTVQETPAEITAQQQGFRPEFFADVSGPLVPILEALVYGFETASGWSQSGGSALATDTGVEGTNALKITRAGALEDACEALTLFDGSDSNGTIALLGSPLTQGSDAVEMTRTGGGYPVLWEPAASKDWSGSLFAFDFDADSDLFSGPGSDVGAVLVYFEDGDGDSYRVDFGTDHFTANTTETFLYRPGDLGTDWGLADGGESGTFNAADIVKVTFQLQKDGILIVDNIRVVSLVEVIQRTDLGGIEAGSYGGVPHRVSIKATASSTLEEACDALTDWAVDLDADTWELAGSALTEGTDSILLGVAQAPDDTTATWTPADTSRDWTGLEFRMDAAPNAELALQTSGSITYVDVVIQTGGGAGNSMFISLSGNEIPDVADEVFTIACPVGLDPANHGYPRGSIDAGFDPSDITAIKITVTRDTTAPYVERIFRFDNLRTELAQVSSVKLWLSDESPAGATPPTNRGELVFMAPTSSWVEQNLVLAEVGTPDLTDADTIGIEIVWPSNATLASVWIDGLYGNNAPAAGYQGSVGDVIETAPDIFFHLLTSLCGRAVAEVDAASFAEAATRLGTNRHAVDLRTLGVTFREIASALAFETRCRLLMRPGNAGPEWRLVTAKADYTFDAGDPLPVEGWSRLARSIGEAATDFVGLFDFDPSIAASAGPEAWRAVVVASADDNDTAIPDADLDDALERFGSRSLEPFGFLAIRDADTAADVLGWIVHETIRADRGRYAVDLVPWWVGLELEVGDPVEIANPPDQATAVDAIVVAHVLDPGRQVVALVVESVETSA